MQGTNHSSPVLTALRSTFDSGKTRSKSWRQDQLRRLIAMLKDKEATFTRALYLDLRKSRFEAYITEIGFLIREARYALRHLSKWMQPQYVHTPLMLHPSRKAEPLPCPYGHLYSLPTRSPEAHLYL